MVKTPSANVIKLPNISALFHSYAAIAELQEQGYALPDYPEEASTDEESIQHGMMRSKDRR